MQSGMRMLYRPEAVARHHHDITFASFRRRQEKAGEAAAIFYRKHPELGDFLAVPQAAPCRSGRTLARAAAAASGPRARSGGRSPAPGERSTGSSATTTSAVSNAASRRAEPFTAG